MTPTDDELRACCTSILGRHYNVFDDDIIHLVAKELLNRLPPSPSSIDLVPQTQRGLTRRQRKLVEDNIQQLRDLGEPDNIEQAEAFELLLGKLLKSRQPTPDWLDKCRQHLQVVMSAIDNIFRDPNRSEADVQEAERHVNAINEILTLKSRQPPVLPTDAQAHLRALVALVNGHRNEPLGVLELFWRNVAIDFAKYLTAPSTTRGDE